MKTDQPSLLKKTLQSAILIGSVLLPFTFSYAAEYEAQVVKINVEERNDFVVEPAKVEVFLKPGETVVHNIAVVSRINGQTKFSIDSEDFLGSKSEDSPVILLGDGKSPFSFKDNLAYPMDEFTLELGDKITIPITITADENARPGGYYASAIIASSKDSTSSGGGAVTKIVSRVGVLFFIRIEGPVEESGEIADFAVSPNRVIHYNTPDEFRILFENTGSVHLAPYGYIYIDNMFGTQIARLPVDAYFSMPDSLRYRTIKWSDSAFRLGLYKARLELNKGYQSDKNAKDIKSISFWVIPWKPVVILLVLILGLLFIKQFIFAKYEFRRRK